MRKVKVTQNDAERHWTLHSNPKSVKRTAHGLEVKTTDGFTYLFPWASVAEVRTWTEPQS